MAMVVVQMSPRLRQMAEKGMEETAKKILESTIEDSKEICKEKAPVDTGYLRDSIVSKSSDNEATLESDASYWVYVNYGTINQEPQPFVDETVNEIPPLLEKYFEEYFGK